MPNWCDTDIRLIAKEPEKLEKFLQDYLEFDNDWEYDILKAIAAKHKDDIPCSIEDIGGRGTIYYCDNDICHYTDSNYDFYYISFSANEAWAPNLDFWNFIANVYDLKFLYSGIEPGCEVYQTNDYDELFYGKYAVNCIDQEWKEDFAQDEKEVLSKFESFIHEHHLETNELFKGWDQVKSLKDLDAIIKNFYHNALASEDYVEFNYYPLEIDDENVFDLSLFKRDSSLNSDICL